VHAVENGVDLNRFSSDRTFETPFRTEGPHLVFTGNMDYWPNMDAVRWFVADILPLLKSRCPTVEFHVVGANPGRDVLRLANTPGVHVTGRVPDTRPFVAHADACVVPLRVARGIQNKVLEAMAMGRPVVASRQAFEGVRAVPGRDLLVADGATETAARILEVLKGAHPGLNDAARAAMTRSYAWSATLSQLDAILDDVSVTNLMGSAA
jgi:sugar transferase (PEP-CTERM/EpsH1 system associated)